MAEYTQAVGAYPESIVIDCARLDDTCIRELFQHGMFDHHYHNGCGPKYGCTHALNELFMSIRADASIWGYLTTEHILGWCTFMRSISDQNPQCPHIELRFRKTSESDSTTFAFSYMRALDTIALIN